MDISKLSGGGRYSTTDGSPDPNLSESPLWGRNDSDFQSQVVMVGFTFLDWNPGNGGYFRVKAYLLNSFLEPQLITDTTQILKTPAWISGYPINPNNGTIQSDDTGPYCVLEVYPGWFNNNLSWNGVGFVNGSLVYAQAQLESGNTNIVWSLWSPLIDLSALNTIGMGIPLSADPSGKTVPAQYPRSINQDTSGVYGQFAFPNVTYGNSYPTPNPTTGVGTLFVLVQGLAQVDNPNTDAFIRSLIPPFDYIGKGAPQFQNYQYLSGVNTPTLSAPAGWYAYYTVPGMPVSCDTESGLDKYLCEAEQAGKDLAIGAGILLGGLALAYLSSTANNVTAALRR